MKLKEGFKLHKLGSENIVVAEGDAAVDYSNIISLNETGAYIWETIEGKEFDAEFIKSALLMEYDVDEETSLNDAFDFIEKLLEADLVRE